MFSVCYYKEKMCGRIHTKEVTLVNSEEGD